MHNSQVLFSETIGYSNTGFTFMDIIGKMEPAGHAQFVSLASGPYIILGGRTCSPSRFRWFPVFLKHYKKQGRQK